MEKQDPGQESFKRDSVGIGILIAIGLHVVCGPILSVLVGGLVSQDFALMSLVCCGLSQLIYMVPAMLSARAKGYPAVLRGIALITAITFLLNAGCWGLLALNPIH